MSPLNNAGQELTGVCLPQHTLGHPSGMEGSPLWRGHGQGFKGASALRPHAPLTPEPPPRAWANGDSTKAPSLGWGAGWRVQEERGLGGAAGEQPRKELLRSF